MKSTRKERISWYLYDWANSAFYTTVITVFLGPYLTGITKNAADADGFVSLFGISIFAGSYFAYMVSFSVLLQLIFLPVVAAIADYSRRKKLMLGIFAYLGAFSTMGLYFLDDSNYQFGGFLFVLANLSFGASVVIYNSFLNDIAEEDQRDNVSSVGWALGYLGGGIVLALNLALFSNAENLGITEGMAVRISLCSAGAWWALFTIFPVINLKIRGNIEIIPRKESLFTVGFKQLAGTFKNALNYPRTLIFLGAFLLYNEGVQTVIALSSQFGQEELGLGLDTLTTAILMVQFIAFFGAFAFKYLARAINSKNAILISIVIWSGTLVYAYGFLDDKTGFFILAGAIALVLGGIQALSRSLYSLVIPKGKEAEYYSFYEITDRGTSWIGPLLFGLALQMTQSYRIAILSLVIFFILGFVILIFLNIPKAIRAAGNKVPETFKKISF